MNNMQAYKRCNVDGEGIITTESGDIRLRLIEISAAEALVAVPRMLAINGRYKFQLVFDINITEMRVQTEAEVTGLEENEGDRYVYDIRFLNLKPNNRIEIDEAINHCFMAESKLSLIS